jgi:hypothetical protein
VVWALGACVVEADVVGGPFGTEGLALGGDLPDQIGEVAVVGVAAGFGAGDRDDLVGHVVPIVVEVL